MPIMPLPPSPFPRAEKVVPFFLLPNDNYFPHYRHDGGLVMEREHVETFDTARLYLIVFCSTRGDATVARQGRVSCG